MAHPMQSLKNALLNSTDFHLMPENLRMTQKGTLEVRRSYFYRLGMSAEKWFEEIEKAALKQGFEVSGYADDRYAIYPKTSYFVAVIESAKQIEYLPGGDAGMFPAAHPRPMIGAELHEPGVGDKVRITLKRHAFDGEVGTISRIPNMPFNEYTVEFEGFGSGFYKHSEFEVVEPAPILDAEYAVWSDSINPGWTADELIASLRTENLRLLDIIGRLQDSLGAAEREIVFLRHRPEVLR